MKSSELVYVRCTGSGFCVGSVFGSLGEPPDGLEVGVAVGVAVGLGLGVSGGATGIVSSGSGTSIYFVTTSSIFTASALVIKLNGLKVPSG